MDHGRRWHRFAARLALIACLIAASVPAAGVVICFAAADGTVLGIGLGQDCPCGLDDSGDHSHCTDVTIDGVRDRVPVPEPLPDHAPAAWIDCVLSLAPTGVATMAIGPPTLPAATADPPELRRALASRRSVVLLI